MADSSSSLFGIHGAALGLREARLDVLASNLANVDTPGYQARDVDFQRALIDATQGKDPASRLATTEPGHIGQGQGGPASATEVYRIPLQRSLDGNTVDGEYEHAAFGRAALEYRATLSFIDNRVRTLTTAITGG